MEDLAGEKEMSEQLEFENLLPKEKETPEIIPIRADGLNFTKDTSQKKQEIIQEKVS